MVAGLPREPRFLGWREWTPITPSGGAGQEVVHRHAIWSDEEDLLCSDGFQINAWMAQHQASRRKAQQPSRTGQATDALPPISPSAASSAAQEAAAGLRPDRQLLRAAYGGGKNLGKASRDWAVPGMVPEALPPLEPATSSQKTSGHAGRRHDCRRNVDAFLELAQMVDANAAISCRSGLAEKMQELEQQRAERARRQRECVNEQSRMNRQQVVLRKQREHGRIHRQTGKVGRGINRLNSVDDDDQVDDSNLEVARARRLMQVFARIQQGQVSVEGDSHGNSNPAARKGSQVVKKRGSGKIQGEEKESLKSKLRNWVWEGVKERKRKRHQKIKKHLKCEREFQALPILERQCLVEAFNACADKDELISKSGTLKCLVELGLRGSNADEREVVKMVVGDLMRGLAREATMHRGQHWGSSSGGEESEDEDEDEDQPEDDGFGVANADTGDGGTFCPLEVLEEEEQDAPRETKLRLCCRDFCATVVPAARGELFDARLDIHSHHFLSALRKEQNVAISQTQLEELAKSLALDTDLIARSISLWSGSNPTIPNPKAAAPLLRRNSFILSMHGIVKGDRQGQPPPEIDQMLEIDAVHNVLMWAEEHTQRRRCKRERDIQQETGLSRSMFWKWRSELVKLHDIFHAYDEDQSGSLSHEEALMLLMRIGMQPYSQHMSSIVEKFLEDRDTKDTGEVDFIGLITIMDDIRRYQTQLRARVLMKEFRRFDVDCSGELNHKETIALFHAASIAPTRVEQDAALGLLEQFDGDQNGELNFSEMQVLTQHVIEKIHSDATQKGFDVGKSLGFDTTRIAMYMQMFDKFEEGGKLRVETATKAIHTFMDRPPGAEEIATVFKDIDSEKRQKLGFLDVLLLMKRLGEGRHMSVKEYPFTLKGLSEQKLREVLQLYPIAASYIRNLQPHELLENVCNYTGWRADQNLRDLPDPIRNPRQLCDRIRHAHGRPRRLSSTD
mmetsp:Transcript_26996/g.89592  ORF Transcript_26996/g.89592 Transcript_26996/m.89592 type:complete len:962 (-) Transcript_26996:44-2929(-)